MSTNAVITLDALPPTTHTKPISSQKWSSHFAFVMAAVGSAVGLGNIWKFPYMTGTSGGGAFVLVYLACVAMIGLPILIAEVTIGRAGGASPMGALRNLAAKYRASRHWQIVGLVGALTALLVLSFYSVVAGWALAYVPVAATGKLAGISGAASETIFNTILADPVGQIGWHTAFMATTVLIVSRGIGGGIERAVTWLMPMLAVLLVLLVAYAAAQGAFLDGAAFLFAPDFSALGTEAVLSAAGHAFFTLSVGLGAMIAYGGYLPEGVSIPRTAITIAALDTLCALAAGLAIFPLVFAHGLDPAGGPGLVFVTLPVAFGGMPGGDLFGALFFILLGIAAVTSAVALLEPIVATMVERGFRRSSCATMLGLLCWAIGLASVFSFNVWSDVRIAGDERTIFDWLNLLTSDILLPLGGIAIALFVGWAMPLRALGGEIDLGPRWLRAWRALVRYIAPAAVAMVLVSALMGAAA
ncbi:sodium-dependent transporter [Erythrobacter donghaensis]|jgi:NSS family neurotransmitter:Na+ symporter|uniref:sodium-dependent transporter n=2 Tax=Erythrobacter donghaensis TaxID=267135 RepID=UPI00093D0123|nr:sodium-dependent transporter [Erythrobacter donghaensis]